MKICPIKPVENVEEFSTLFSKDQRNAFIPPPHFLSLQSRTLCSPPNPQKAQLTQVSCVFFIKKILQGFKTLQTN